MKELKTAYDAIVASEWGAIAAVVVVCALAFLTSKFLWWFLNKTLFGIGRQASRKKIKSAMEGAQRNVSSLVTALDVYQDALERLIDVYESSPENIETPLKDFRSVCLKTSLPKIDVEKVNEALLLSHSFSEYAMYSNISKELSILSAFCNSYKEFFVELNVNMIEDIEKMIHGQHHSGAVTKPDLDYIMQKTTKKDVDNAIRYFRRFKLFLEKCRDTVQDLSPRLTAAIQKNRYNEIFAAAFPLRS